MPKGNSRRRSPTSKAKSIKWAILSTGRIYRTLEKGRERLML